MGIKGLLSHIEATANECGELVDLVNVGKTKTQPVEIIMDIKGVRRELYEQFVHFFMRSNRNPHLILPGGEYEILEKYLTNYFQQLKSVGLKLTFVADFLYPSDDTDPLEIKHHRKKKKRLDHFKANRSLMKALELGNSNALRKSSNGIPLPEFYGDILTGVIKKLGFEIIYPFGNESDYERASITKERNAFALLTNDTECVVFRDVPLILWRLFDIGKKLRFQINNQISSPPSLSCYILRSSALQRQLNLSSHDQLIDLTSLAGNLFTNPYMKTSNLFDSLRIPKDFYKFSEFVRMNSHYDHLEDCPQVDQVIQKRERSQEIREGFSQARKYFNLLGDPTARAYDTIADPVIQFLIMPCNVTKYGDFVFQPAFGSAWLTMPMQDLDIPAISEKLLPINQRIFGLLHKAEKQSFVNVYICPDRVTLEVLSQSLPPISTGDGSTVEDITEDDVDRNMQRFKEIMAYYEEFDDDCNDQAANFLNRQNFQLAVLIYCYRLLIRINPSGNYFNQDDFIALLTSIWSLYIEKYHGKIHLGIMRKIYQHNFPVTLKHLTLFNWFQEILSKAIRICDLLQLDKFIDRTKLAKSLSMQLFVAFSDVISSESQVTTTQRHSSNVKSQLSSIMKQVRNENELSFKQAMKYCQ